MSKNIKVTARLRTHTKYSAQTIDIPDAATDNKLYGRQDGQWVDITDKLNVQGLFDHMTEIDTKLQQYTHRIKAVHVSTTIAECAQDIFSHISSTSNDLIQLEIMTSIPTDVTVGTFTITQSGIVRFTESKTIFEANQTYCLTPVRIYTEDNSKVLVLKTSTEQFNDVTVTVKQTGDITVEGVSNTLVESALVTRVALPVSIADTTFGQVAVVYQG